MFGKNQDDLQRLLNDVTHRQIDTIVADAIQGTSLTNPVEGLQQIAGAYASHLRTLGVELPDGIETGDRASFENLCELAKTKYEANGSHTAADLALAGRIARRSARLTSVAARIESANPGAFENKPTGEIEINLRDRATISAAWELGTAPIAMQSVISLDGDIVTRVSRTFSDAEHAAVHQIHNESVTVSLNTWQMLVEGIGSLARSFLR